MNVWGFEISKKCAYVLNEAGISICVNNMCIMYQGIIIILLAKDVCKSKV